RASGTPWGLVSPGLMLTLSRRRPGALLINPLVHDQAPYSLIMELTIICHFFDTIETAFGKRGKLKRQDVAPFGKVLARQLEMAISIIIIVLEQIDSQLNLLGHEKTPEAATQEISRGLP